MSASDATLAALHLAVNEADKRFRALKRDVDTEARAASAAVHAKYADATRKLNDELRAAQIARDVHIDETASHPWEGKKVYRNASSGSMWSKQTKRVEGIVEVRRKGTVLPANISWGLPDLGQAFVRKLKKDGTTGTAIDAYTRVENWTLCEDEEQAKQVQS